MIPWCQHRLSSCGAWLDRLPRPVYLATAAAGSLLLSLLFFSPKFQLWDLNGGENFEVVRARSYLAQCVDPLRRDVEPAMQWRLLPPLVAHALGLPARGALALPWIGIGVLLATCTGLLWREGLTRLQAALATALVATSSAVLVPTGWLGLNDAWVWAGLAGVALGRGWWSLLPAGLLLPWVDERFIIGLPLAVAVRAVLANRPGKLLRLLLIAAGSLLPYVVLRLVLHARGLGDPSAAFLQDTLAGFLTWLPFAPLGWWMAWRAAWIPLGLGLAGAGRAGLWLGLAVFGTLAVMAVLASDLSRSAALLLPVVLLGLVRLGQSDPARADLRLAGVLALNLVLPALHVVHVRTGLISPLPLELFRLLRHLGKISA